MDGNSHRNRLNEASSPYLLQHANNPVHWQPWDEAALALARRADKPILLSIGYSACHWCHVMAHESFEDAETAAVMNQHFICIKVDREERPDIDKVYQLSHHLLTQENGGWPLTMFVDPHSHVPFYGGTYFPKHARYGLPGFVELMLRVATVYREKPDDLKAQGQKLMATLASLTAKAPEKAGSDIDLLNRARSQLTAQYDERYGGFGSAPKFPMPLAIERILRHWAYARRRDERDREGLEMAMQTLTGIARAASYDHLGGGFCRYATDRAWMIPHFEKMLYDNGLLLSAFADALAIGPDELFAGAARESAEWLIRDMQHSQGGFESAIDADSEGIEGSFYAWRREEVKRLLTEDEYLVVETLYGLDKPSNFESKWILHRYDAWHAVVHRLSLERDVADARLASARAKLFAARSERVPPGKDDKIITSWNGLAIRGLVKVGLVLKEPRFIEAASRALDFIAREMRDDTGLYATWRQGRLGPRAFLDDYANLLEGTLALLRARWRDDDARLACQLADESIARFRDADGGGFYFTPHDHESLIHRPRPTLDEVTPSGNSTMARALLALGHLFGEPRYLDAGRAILTWARGMMESYPAGHAGMLAALEDEVVAPEQVILRGPEAQILEWADALRSGFTPWRTVYAIPYSAVVLPKFLPRLVAAELRAKAVGYHCAGLTCSLPVDDLDTLKRSLSAAH
ncbi:MAG: thioredoxin domain-containing protein [Gammaproteobacteria bacterium]|nr:thioredoxin domain-containing protein [Gammaproteobacteria bacterium]